MGVYLHCLQNYFLLFLVLEGKYLLQHEQIHLCNLSRIQNSDATSENGLKHHNSEMGNTFLHIALSNIHIVQFLRPIKWESLEFNKTILRDHIYDS